MEDWDWCDRGLVIFLGGDQIYPLIIGRRLGYRTLVYAEWEARWYRWIDAFGVMQPGVMQAVPAAYHSKFRVVGDLMADVPTDQVTHRPQVEQQLHLDPGDDLVGILPGSKPAKLRPGLPMALAVAERVRAQRPQTRFVIPVAPTLDLPALAQFANPAHNPILPLVQGQSARLVPCPDDGTLPYLETPTGLRVHLWTEFPAHALLTRCRLCLTTVGANTAELGALAVPMIVGLPTQQLEAMRSWDGLPGILANLPGIGTPIARLISWLVVKAILRQGKLLAWPNIWAHQTEIVPEMIGPFYPQDFADRILDFLEHPDRLQAMAQRLRQVRGSSGAASRLVEMVCDALDYPSESFPSVTHAANPLHLPRESKI